MPELPEVESIRLQLQEILPLKVKSFGKSSVVKSILHVESFDPVGKILKKIERKGKMLDFIFDKDLHMLSHLGMTGSWRMSSEPLEEKHKHMQFFGKGPHGNVYLSYVDPRRFGHAYLFDKDKAKEKLNELGLDLKDPALDFNYMKSILKKYPKRAIKDLLLDQRFFAGTGNYIANEMCARAFVRPTRPAGKLTLKEIQSLLDSLPKILDPAIDKGGTTFQGGYTDAKGEKGKGVTNLVVFYQKTCRQCNETPVKKIFLKQRGTYYCPQCQK